MYIILCYKYIYDARVRNRAFNAYVIMRNSLIESNSKLKNRNMSRKVER